MVSTTSATKLTYESFLSLPDDGLRHELIDGAHYVLPSPTLQHQRVLRRLFVALCQYAETHPIGEVFCGPCDVVLSDIDVLVPDVLVVLNDQSDILTKAHVRGAPAIVVEILSPATRRRDVGLKLRVYNAHGVREYWIVDPLNDVVTVNRRSESMTLDDRHEFSRAASDVLTSPLLPGFSQGLRDLFR